MEPSLPRKRKRQVYYEAGNAEAAFHEAVECQYSQIITKQLTQLSAPYKTVSIKMDGYKTCLNLENVLLKAIRNESLSKNLAL